MAVTALAPPSKLALLFELPRAAWSVVSHLGAQRNLQAMPRGDGRPVMVLPGLFNTDRSNFVMRSYLKQLGYRAYPWELGRNRGALAVGPDAEKLIARVEALHYEAGEKVTLIGVSLGGIMARIVAHRRPDLVREVITVSSPYAGPATATNVWRAFELFTGERITDPAVQAHAAEAAAPSPVPTTAIWSASDGLVNGMICYDDACRAIEVRSSHIGVQLKPEVLIEIAKVLGGA